MKEKRKSNWSATVGANMARSVPGIILAAGASSRLGEPKLLVNVGGTPLVRWAYENLKTAGCEPIIVVTRAELSVDVLLAVPDAIVSINPHPEAGRTGSLQNGISSLHSELGRLPRKVVMAPVDRPGWNASLVKALTGHDESVCPIHQGRKGHPVVLNGDDLERILSVSSATPLRDIVSFKEVTVHGPWLHLNIDTPESLSNLQEDAAELHAYFLR
ncbi:NTP transferase domain-containing protein [Candidatus Poseidonia alphae]|nr:NTP transferase domain-containing protein [Candidatus Poseidonia alphae]MDA8531032.1 NTP transferase domain-containing protein [Candidatus Poseidonia alphae]MDA8639301.1 NTP transferase domain-containing protein [Candidatus Poseidonia alphae]MDA9168257.1 NTP transferase domain-containing protein [Candidatus Poseidonia alphae]MDB2637329.1 NTP transferase domain-containing protein [Candidatus Poseidonia alphae]